MTTRATKPRPNTQATPGASGANGFMVGRRKPPSVTFDADAQLLRAACTWNESMQSLPTGGATFFPKGVYRYKTHEEAQLHWDRCVAEGMARIALEKAKNERIDDQAADTR